MLADLRDLLIPRMALRAVDPGAGTAGGLPSVTADEALAAEAARYAAQTANDFAAMERLFGDDLVYIHSSTAVDTKASFIESIRSGAVRYRRMTPGDVTVRTYGTLAIVTGSVRSEVTVQGQDLALDLLFHAVWARRAGGLQFVSWQATRRPAQA